MEVRPLTDKTALAVLLKTQPLQPFLQSWAWGEFQATYGRRIWRLGSWQGSELVGAALVIEHKLLMGKTYLYCPRGPLAGDLATLQALLAAIETLGAQAGAMYVKADLNQYAFPVDPKSFTGFSVGTTLQPRQTLIINTGADQKELLYAMHQKTRYNIRLAEKRGVKVRWSKDPSDFRTFLDLIHSTYRRQGIRLHPDPYYELMFETLGLAEMCELALAEYAGQVLAANFIVWHGQTGTYLHGGSSEAHKDMMAPHLLQWRAIERAQERGVRAYDLWGVAPEHELHHPWSGVTRFKKGFGGHVEIFQPALNAVINQPWYWTYRMAKRIRGGIDE